MVDTGAQICELFQKSKATISEHIKNVFEEGELEALATVRNFRTVQTEGPREVERAIEKEQSSKEIEDDIK